MTRAFEAFVRLNYGDRYDLSKDSHGYYCREIVKRMWETWCNCKGITA